MISIGTNVDARDEFDDTALVNAIQIENEDIRFVIVEMLLVARANPKLIDDDSHGPLFAAVLSMDYRVLELLLKYGADPNAELCCEEPESLYDFAEIDYRYQAFDFELAEDPSNEDKATEENWLEYLDRLAIKYGKRRPDYLQLLRRAGAKTYRELVSVRSA